MYQAESTDVLLPKESDQENNIIEGNGNLRIYRKKDKNKPKGKGVKKWTVLKGAFIWLCKIKSSARRQRDRAVIFLLQYEQEHLDYCQRVMCVCACALQWNLCPAMCGLLFYRLWTFIREFNLHVVYPIGIFIIFFCYFIIIMCIILVYSLCTWILNCDYFTLCYSSQLQGIVRELRYRHDYF